MRFRLENSTESGLFKFFRNQLVPLSESDILELDESYTNDIKNLKYNLFKIGWHMRGALTHHDLFYIISIDDREVLNKIIKEQIELVEKTKLAIL
jgi:hypothetical protein